MGIVWEAYHKGVPLLGVPENPIDIIQCNLYHLAALFVENRSTLNSLEYPPPPTSLFTSRRTSATHSQQKKSDRLDLGEKAIQNHHQHILNPQHPPK